MRFCEVGQHKLLELEINGHISKLIQERLFTAHRKADQTEHNLCQVASASFILRGQRQEHHLHSAKAEQAGKQPVLSGEWDKNPRATMQMLAQLHKE